MKARRWTRTIVLIGLFLGSTVVGLGVPGISVPVTLAHNELCGDGQPFRWSGTTAGMYFGGLTAQYQTAVANAKTNFNTTDFDYFETSAPAAQIHWNNLNSSDTNIAGATDLAFSCSTHRIATVTMYFNYPHFTAATHNADQRQCTAIHEMGHAVGLAHNNVTSVMTPDHGPRCHGTTIMKTLQTHDVSDINAKY